MFKDTALHTFEPSTSLPEVTLEVPCEPVVEVAQPSGELRPKSATELASDYGVSDKTIQTWYKSVCAAYCWLDPGVLKTGSSNKTRYTPICQELIAQYRVAVKDLSEEAWIASVHADNADKISAGTPSEPTKTPNTHPVMVPYQPQAGEMERFTPPGRKIFKFTSTEEFTSQAKKNTEMALDVTQSNSTALTDALVNQMQQEGQKLGLTLFQAKYGTAHSVLAELEQALAKKSGLAEEAHPPTAG